MRVSNFPLGKLNIVRETRNECKIPFPWEFDVHSFIHVLIQTKLVPRASWLCLWTLQLWKPSIHGVCLGYSKNKARETLLSISLKYSFYCPGPSSLEKNLISVPQMCSQMWSSSHTGLLDKAKRFCWLFLDISHSPELESSPGLWQLSVVMHIILVDGQKIPAISNILVLF